MASEQDEQFKRILRALGKHREQQGAAVPDFDVSASVLRSIRTVPARETERLAARQVWIPAGAAVIFAAACCLATVVSVEPMLDAGIGSVVIESFELSLL